MTNQDKKKGCLSGVFFILSFIFPVISLFIGWISGGWKVGAIAGLVTFAVFFLLGSVFAIWIETPSWFTIMLPTIAGLTYGILPDTIPLRFDDAAAAAAGAILSFALALKQYSDLPKWTIIPWLGAAVYTLVGGLIPGPVDEIFVGLISTGVVGREVYKLQAALKNEDIVPAKSDNIEEPEVFEGEIIES